MPKEIKFKEKPDLVKRLGNHHTFQIPSGSENIISVINKIYRAHGLIEIKYESKNHIDYISLKDPVTKKSNHPTVDIITPIGKCKEFLSTVEKSIINQSSLCNWIVIFDDYENNNILFKDIKYFNPISLGTYGARNYGLKVCVGEFITVHDADDWSHPQKIELQLQALIENPRAVASVSHWARCTSDMNFETRVDGTIVHRNVSSLMVRREVIDKLGYWDRVSVNADTEYYYRILAAYGPESIVEVLPGVPLSFGRRHANSLTMQPQTHWKTQFGGVRKDYMDAAHEWHKECANTNNWFMPYAPKNRPFPIPELIDRSVIELGDRVWPHIRGQQAVSNDKPCVLLCGHASGNERFGAERSLLDLAKAICSLGYRLIITLPERNVSYIKSLKPWCSDIILLPNPWQKDDEIWPVTLDAYSRLLVHYKIDIVHVNTLVNRVPVIAARQQGVQIILHVRELLKWDFDLRQSMGNYTDHAQLLDADLVLANSAYTANCITNAGFNGNLKVVANTVELNGVWRVRNFVQGELIRVGMVSSNLPKKGLEDFVAVAAASNALNLPLQFVLVGPDNCYTQKLKKDLPGNILVLGYCDTPEQAFIHLDILLNLSNFQESFGRTVAEAMLAGKPVICYRWGALPELIENGSNGYLVHLGDIDGIVNRLNYLCEHPELIEKLGENGQAIAHSRFNQYDFQAKLGSAYRSILQSKKRSPIY
ncbi:glycosyltransferase (plasmid) [Escherichia coli]